MHETRLEMVNRALNKRFGPRLARIRCLNIGCYGRYYLNTHSHGAEESAGGARHLMEESLEEARFMLPKGWPPQRKLQARSGEGLTAQINGRYELTLLIRIDPLLVSLSKTRYLSSANIAGIRTIPNCPKALAGRGGSRLLSPPFETSRLSVELLCRLQPGVHPGQTARVGVDDRFQSVSP
jgi:hypothetical protein